MDAVGVNVLDVAISVPKAVAVVPGPWYTAIINVPVVVVINPPQTMRKICPGEGAFCPYGKGRNLFACATEKRDVGVVAGETAPIGEIKLSARPATKYCLAIIYQPP